MGEDKDDEMWRRKRRRSRGGVGREQKERG